MSDDPTKRSVGESQYHKHEIQPWDIWQEYKLNPWDADIIKRVLRSKGGEEGRILDYEKIIHICEKRLSMLKVQCQSGNGADCKPVDRRFDPDLHLQHKKLLRYSSKWMRRRCFINLAGDLNRSVPCYCCGEPVSWRDSTLEHIIPLADGGSKGSLDNHAISHKVCNWQRGIVDNKRRQLERVKLGKHPDR